MKSAKMLKNCAVGLLSLSAAGILSAPALAQVTLPKLATGRHVYTIPQNFDPPLIGQAGIKEIETAASKLHYPFFVVLVKDLPGGTDQAAASLVDGYAAEWTTAFPSIYDPLKSQIFVLTYNPRKFRFLAGGQFKNNLHFEKDAHKPYTDIFVQSVSGTPKDPKSGIINMMQAVDEYLFEHTDPQRLAQRDFISNLRLLALGLIVLGIVLLIRLFLLKRRRQAFEAQWAKSSDKLQNAYQNFAIIDAETRDMVLSLKDMEGETRELYHKVTGEIDEITLSLGALQAHLDACKAKADSANLLSSGRIKRAEKAINQTFYFDTGKANSQDLFGSPTVVLHLNIGDFFVQMQQRYAKAKKGWNQLKKVAEAAWHPPQEALPTDLGSRFEAVPASLRVGLEHPLSPASKAEALYQELEALRWKDAIVYARRIEEIQQTHQQLLDQITEVEQGLKKAAAAEALQAPSYSNLVLTPKDQPKALLERAKGFHQDLKNSLDTGVAFTQLQSQLTRTLEAYQAFQTLEDEIGAALGHLPGKLTELEQAQAELEALQKTVAQEIAVAKRHHRGVDFTSEQTQAERTLQQAPIDSKAISELKQEHRDLDAWRQALKLENKLKSVRKAYAEILAKCRKLAEQKQNYERTLAEMRNEVTGYNHRMSNYGHSPKFQAPAYDENKVYDYALLLSAAQSMRQQWSDSVSEAAAAYQAEMARRSAQSSSSSSSWGSDSSWSSSSSGGSWDSGSSSSDSSSSGGSW